MILVIIVHQPEIALVLNVKLLDLSITDNVLTHVQMAIIAKTTNVLNVIQHV